MRKTWEVIRFEVSRSLKKPSFWIAAILIPVIFIGYILIVGMSSYSAEESLSEASDTSELNLGYYDGAGYLEGNQFKNKQDQEQTMMPFDSQESGVKAIKSGEIDVFYYIAPDFAESKEVKVYAKPEHLTLTTDYSETIKALLQYNATKSLEDIDLAVINDEISVESINFDKDDQEVSLADQIKRIVAPIGMFVLLELIVMTLSSRLSNALVEEKENRISELLLTSIKPIALMTGKIVSLMIIGLIQILVLFIPAAIITIIAKDKGVIPEEFNIAFDLSSFAQYFVLLLAAYFSITSAYVLVGVLSPTAKDCANYASIVAVFMILPMITMNVFMGDEVSVVARIMTYAPFSGPLALAIRAVFNNLESWEFFVTLASSLLTGGILTIIATRIFCRNSVDSSFNFNLKKMLGARTEWKR